MIETSSAADRDPQRTEASLEDNIQIRNRSSPVKNPESVDVSPSPVTPRRLWE
ncbi:OX-2 membrane glycoprotein-like isoform X1 [Xyrichtys novacula]|uniref:OX-2 membrane glycoprotein-like isoform X1 n=1 Tax=Xyrichtys novacula TaxID=13765 RepID=A0AAV1HNA3_XYRNO|nr:OX-2 membrane glycoprotein-like isoform X1 [Xyrichtys novacula]